MTLDWNDFYIKIVALDEIYNFVILSFFIWGRFEALQIHYKSICIVRNLCLEKLYFLHVTSDENDLYMKIVVLNEIYSFVVLNFFHLKSFS